MAIRTHERPVGEARGVGADHQRLIEGLNEDLAGELQAIVMYLTFAAKLTGPHRRELRSLFLEEIDDERKHAQILADKIAVLGGEPTTQPREVPHATDAREMVRCVFEAEQETINRYRRRIEEADTAGEIGLRVDLEDIIADETRHRDEMDQILNDWRD